MKYLWSFNRNKFTIEDKIPAKFWSAIKNKIPMEFEYYLYGKRYNPK